LKRYVVDSNLYIQAIRDRPAAAALAEFSVSYAPYLLLHAVVVQELMAGAINQQARSRLERNLITPLERRGRLLVPTYRAWKRAGEIIATLIQRRHLSVTGVPRSFPNDALIAASCREQGMTLITENESDFAKISLVEPVDFVTDWPRKHPES
jgi:predicted nucleic acid-binding protein